MPAFSPHRADNVDADLAAVLARVKAAPSRPANAAAAPLIFAVSPSPDATLTAYDLAARRAVFSVKADIRSRVIVGRGAIFAREGEREFVARDVAAGKVIWRHAIEGGATFLGAASDGDGVTYVTEESGPRVAGRDVATIVGLDAASGKRRWKIGAHSRLGAPAAREGLVFVPFASQSIAVLDGRSGEELARLRNEDEAITFVLSAPEGVFYGSRGVFRLDARSIGGRRDAASYASAKLPSDPMGLVRGLYHFDGYNAAQAGYTAYDRNRLLWHAGKGAPFDGPVVLHSYRFFFGFDPASGDVKWAYSFPRHDVMASEHTGTHIVMLSSEGEIVALDARSGAEAWSGKLDGRVAGATLDVRGFSPPERITAQVDLRETLIGIVWDPDRRFEAIKLFCVGELARLTHPNVTDDLIKVVTFEKIDRKVYEKAGAALLERVSAADVPLLVRELAIRTDYVSGARARAVDLLARASGKLATTDAVEPLLAHFRDHETALLALREVVKALDAIGSKTVLGPFREFLLTYRTDPDLAQEPDVLRRVCDALLRLGIAHDRQLLRFVAEDPQTAPYLRNYAGELLRKAALHSSL